MSDIKVGDLVMVVRPSVCCQRVHDIGQVFTVEDITNHSGRCVDCGRMHTKVRVAWGKSDGFIANRLVKIDPPAEGDSLPTRADLEVTA